MPKIYFESKKGASYQGDSLKLINSRRFRTKYEGRVNLIFTSPPFSLARKKDYGNFNGHEYINWLCSFAKPLSDLLTEDGSLVIELGNAFEKGAPIFSTIPIEALLEFKKRSGLYLCQEFICNNPGRLPNPAQWVTIDRVRAKDSYTRIWWLSKTPYPKADNLRVLKTYSKSMLKKMKQGSVGPGKRPSGHEVTEKFLKDNGGSISSNYLKFEGGFNFEVAENTLSISNSSTAKKYIEFCASNGLKPHSARMQDKLVEFFIRFLTEEEDLVFDPFGGSNTTGHVAEKLNRRWVTSELHSDYIKGSLIKFYDENRARNIIARMAKKGL